MAHHRPFALRLTPGSISDVGAVELLTGKLRGVTQLIADKSYDANAFRKTLLDYGARPVIPSQSNRKRKVNYDKARYRERHLVENAFCRLKDFRRIATRYDKLGGNSLSSVTLVIVIAFRL